MLHLVAGVGVPALRTQRGRSRLSLCVWCQRGRLQLCALAGQLSGPWRWRLPAFRQHLLDVRSPVDLTMPRGLLERWQHGPPVVVSPTQARLLNAISAEIVLDGFGHVLTRYVFLGNAAYSRNVYTASASGPYCAAILGLSPPAVSVTAPPRLWP